MKFSMLQPMALTLPSTLLFTLTLQLLLITAFHQRDRRLSILRQDPRDSRVPYLLPLPRSHQDLPNPQDCQHHHQPHPTPRSNPRHQAHPYLSLANHKLQFLQNFPDSKLILHPSPKHSIHNINLANFPSYNRLCGVVQTPPTSSWCR